MSLGVSGHRGGCSCWFVGFPPKPRQLTGETISPVMLLTTGLIVLDTQTQKRSGAGGIPAPLYS